MFVNWYDLEIMRSNYSLHTIILIVIITLACPLLWHLIKGKISKLPETRKTKMIWWILILLVIMGAFEMGFQMGSYGEKLEIVQKNSLPYPLAPTITVEITSPQEDAIIPYNNITVKGKASNVPEDKYLWVITKQQGDIKFYPRAGRIPIYEDTWNMEIWLATQDKKYSIFACLANKTANDNLTNYANTRKQKGDPGMTSLPNRVEICDRIHVTWSVPE
jgi:hypothetical protein